MNTHVTRRPNLANLSLLIALGAIVGAASSLAGASSHQPPAQHEPASFDSVRVTHSLTLDGANQVLAGALAQARALKAGGAIAVVDEGGHLIAFQRIDDTFAAGAEVSIGKASTAALFKKPTKAFEDSIKDGRNALLGVRGMTPLQGGVPIIHEGHVVGAIGVSGAHSQAEDEQIAIAGASAISTLAGK